MNKVRNKFLDDLAINCPNAGQFKRTLQDIKYDLNVEYPKFLKAINSKKLTQDDKREKTSEFIRLLEELADKMQDS